MSQLFQAINNTTETTNGMPAFKSTLNANLNLFFNIATARGADMSDIFLKAYKENSDLALRILQWSRDVRGGAGERQRFRDLLGNLIEVDIESAIKLIPKIPEIGRWDDLWCVYGKNKKYDSEVVKYVAGVLQG